MVVVAGIDVSKATLEVSVSEGRLCCRFDNSGDRASAGCSRHMERHGREQGGVRVHRWV